MRPKTLILILVFVGLVIFATNFIPYYKKISVAKIRNYIESLSICENTFDEQQCFELEKCEGIYGPACLTCQDLEFKRCQKIPERVRKELEKEKELCLNSGGNWQKTKFGYFCVCLAKNGVERKFDRIKGCY